METVAQITLAGGLPQVQPENPQEESPGVNAQAWEGAELRNSGTQGARQSPIQPEDLVQATCPSETQSAHHRVRQVETDSLRGESRRLPTITHWARCAWTGSKLQPLFP